MSVLFFQMLLAISARNISVELSMAFFNFDICLYVTLDIFHSLSFFHISPFHEVLLFSREVHPLAPDNVVLPLFEDNPAFFQMFPK